MATKKPSNFWQLTRRYGLWLLLLLSLIAFAVYSTGNPPRPLPANVSNPTNFSNPTPPVPQPPFVPNTGTLVVIKHVINDDDGISKASHFLIYVNGVNVSRTISGSEEGVNVTLFAGAYNVSEKAYGAYSSGYSDDCVGTIAAGEVKTCIVTNDDVPSTTGEGEIEVPKKNKTIPGGGGDGTSATIIVIKHVINNDTGEASASDFTITISGVEVGGGNSFPGEESPGTEARVVPGEYSISEDGPEGYEATFSGDCSGTIEDGETKTCTITNDDIAPNRTTLTLNKIVVNDNGGDLNASAFPLYIMPNYCQITCDSPEICAQFDNGCTPQQVTSGVPVDVVPNMTYSVWEINAFGYEPLGWVGDCEQQQMPNIQPILPPPIFLGGPTVTVPFGKQRVCNITNDDIAPVLTVVKNVTNDNGGDMGASDFNLTVCTQAGNQSLDTADVPMDCQQVTSGVPVALDANREYIISEGQLEGYNLTGWGIDCDTIGGGDFIIGSLESEEGVDQYKSVTLLPGERRVCTIYNDDIAPTITIVKTVVNDNGGDKNVSDFTLRVDNQTVASGVAVEVTANAAHTVSEIQLPGYQASSWGGDCAEIIEDSVSTMGAAPISQDTITLAPGENAVCTITNDDIAPMLTLVKTVVNENGGNKTVGDFALYIDGSPATSGIPVEVMANQVHTASEDQLEGYAASSWGGDCAANGTVTLAPGQNKTCTITNSDMPGTLVVTKHVVNDNGGTLTAANFTIHVTSGNISYTFQGSETGTNVSLPIGDYNVTEDSVSGYEADYSSLCSNKINKGNDVHSCTITNDDIAPTITIEKIVTNDNGGTLGAGDFTYRIDGNEVSQGTSIEVTANAQHTVSEDATEGYSASSWSGDCDENGTITPSLGGNYTCYITNDDIPATLVVIKSVVNDDGRTLEADDFTIHVNSGNATITFQGSETGTNVTLNAGAYNVTEDAAAGYIGDASADCSGTIGLGEAKTCTITNDDTPIPAATGTLMVRKHVINDNGGDLAAGGFTMHVNTANGTISFAGSESYTNVTVAIGNYTVSEEVNTPTTHGYNGTFSAGCTGSIGESEVKYCNVTNDDIAEADNTTTITIVKTVVGGNYTAQDFDFVLDSSVLVKSGVTVSASAGAHTVYEVPNAAYAASSWGGDCDANGTVVLATGDDAVCTITNTFNASAKTGMLIVRKLVVGGNLTPEDFTIIVTVGINPGHEEYIYNATFPGTSAGVNLTVPTPSPGTPHYTVQEVGDGYYEQTYSGDCSDHTNNIHEGDMQVCNLTNTYVEAPTTGTLVVVKHVINNNTGTLSAANFTMRVTGVNASLSSFAGSEAGTNVTLAPGAYNVSEDGVAGYAGSYSANCSGTIAAGEARVCTVTNDDIPPAPANGTLVVIKNVVGGSKSAKDFTISVTGVGLSITFPGNASGTSISLAPGAYNVTETGSLYGYAPSFSANCSGTMASGATKTCTVTNTK